MRGLFGSSARANVLFLHHRSRSAVFDAEETLVRVRLAVGTAHRFELLRADLGAALERERGQAALHRHQEHVAAAVFPSHVALVRVELVVRAAHVVRRLLLTVGLAQCGGGTVLQRNGDYPQAARLLFHFAARFVGVAVRTTDRAGLFLVVCTAAAVRHVHLRFQLCAGSNMC